MINYYFDEQHELKPFTYQLVANSFKNDDDEIEYSVPPSNALRIEPKFKNGFWPCEKNGKWVQVIDNRSKTVFNIITKQAEIVNYLGKLKDGYTELEPFPFGDCEWNDKQNIWEAKKFIPQILSRAQAETVMDLTPATTPDELNKDKTLLDEINEYMDTLDITVPMYKYIKNVWKNSVEFNRSDDVITTIAAIFKITDEQLDEMFISGAQFSTTLGG